MGQKSLPTKINFFIFSYFTKNRWEETFGSPYITLFVLHTRTIVTSLSTDIVYLYLVY